MGNQQNNQSNRPQQGVRDNSQQKGSTSPGRNSQQPITPDKRDSNIGNTSRNNGNRMDE